MSDWLWIVLGFSVAYLAIATYLGLLLHRWAQRARGEGDVR
ncbi:hypothetical protein [Haloechinothrix sp. LS1_15]|nr:hypothetical protein [Haloechinothrix sp. LS1_15]